jgi:hypothetical protein
MSRFYETEEGKLFAHVIHEHNSAIGMIKNHNLFYERHRNNLEILTEERILSRIQSIKDAVDKAQEAMDLLYVHYRTKHDSLNLLKDENKG